MISHHLSSSRTSIRASSSASFARNLAHSTTNFEPRPPISFFLVLHARVVLGLLALDLLRAAYWSWEPLFSSRPIRSFPPLLQARWKARRIGREAAQAFRTHPTSPILIIAFILSRISIRAVRRTAPHLASHFSPRTR
jgi:hypothetical protein